MYLCCIEVAEKCDILKNISIYMKYKDVCIFVIFYFLRMIWTKTNGAVNVTPLAEEITKLVIAALHEGKGVTARASDGLCDW